MKMQVRKHCIYQLANILEYNFVNFPSHCFIYLGYYVGMVASAVFLGRFFSRYFFCMLDLNQDKNAA